MEIDSKAVTCSKVDIELHRIKVAKERAQVNIIIENLQKRKFMPPKRRIDYYGLAAKLSAMNDDSIFSIQNRKRAFLNYYGPVGKAMNYESNRTAQT